MGLAVCVAGFVFRTTDFSSPITLILAEASRSLPGRLQAVWDIGFTGEPCRTVTVGLLDE